MNNLFKIYTVSDNFHILTNYLSKVVMITFSFNSSIKPFLVPKRWFFWIISIEIFQDGIWVTGGQVTLRNQFS